jgi:hypothetical protein
MDSNRVAVAVVGDGPRLGLTPTTDRSNCRLRLRLRADHLRAGPGMLSSFLDLDWSRSVHRFNAHTGGLKFGSI